MFLLLRQPAADQLLELLKANGQMPELVADLENEIAFEKDPTCDPDREKLLAAAKEEYYEEGDGREINIDTDARLSESDEHAFVMAWVYVPYEDAGIETGEKEDSDDE